MDYFQIQGWDRKCPAAVAWPIYTWFIWHLWLHHSQASLLTVHLKAVTAMNMVFQSLCCFCMFTVLIVFLSHTARSKACLYIQRFSETTKTASIPTVPSRPLWTFFLDISCDILMALLISSYGGSSVGCVSSSLICPAHIHDVTLTKGRTNCSESVTPESEMSFLNPITRRRRCSCSRAAPLETNDLEMKEWESEEEEEESVYHTWKWNDHRIRLLVGFIYLYVFVCNVARQCGRQEGQCHISRKAERITAAGEMCCAAI